MNVVWFCIDTLRKKGKSADLSEAGDEIHEAIYASCGNRRLQRLMDVYRDQVGWLQRLAGLIPNRLAHSLREHEGILAALEARDPDWAEAAARAHVRSTRRDLLQTMAANGGAADGGADEGNGRTRKEGLR